MRPDNMPRPFPSEPQVTAPDILTQARDAIANRAASRDQPGGERSMARAVTAFNALTGHNVSERDGWLFMVCLKAARATAGGHNGDDYIDGAAYFALAGECVEREQAKWCADADRFAAGECAGGEQR